MNIVIAGDNINDVYKICSDIVLDNDDPIFRVTVSNTVESPGGIGLCKRLLESFLDKKHKVYLFPTTDTTLVRFITRSNINLLTADLGTSKLFPDEKEFILNEFTNFIKDNNIDIIYMWGDDRFKRAMQAISVATMNLGSYHIADHKEHILCDADIEKGYINSYTGGFPHLAVETSAEESLIVVNEVIKRRNPSILHPISTCGAGDTLLCAVVATIINDDLMSSVRDHLLKDDYLDRLLKIGQSAAYCKLQHSMTYVPTPDEVMDTLDKIDWINDAPIVEVKDE